jgi:23S rRNA (guanosine2251-2'-O)-methyltransferase
MQNVGAIFRNCDGAGFEKVVLTGHCSTPPRSDISKTALGSETWVDWEYFSDALEGVNNLKIEGYKIYCVELGNKSIEYTQLFEENQKKICLIVWNEVSWVSQKLLDLSDEMVMIPMRWKKESLNVSVAAGIVMYAV